MTRLFLLALVASIQFSCFAQIRGRVIDEQHSPVEFANISIHAADSTVIAGTISNAEGNFELSDIVGLPEYVRISLLGFESQELPVPKTGIFGEIILRPNSTVLNEVVVKGQTPPFHLKNGNLVSTVRNTPLSLLGNALDVLEQLPGIYRENDDISVFGKGNPVIFMNGHILNDYTELQRLSSQEIQNVEVISNPGAKYGADVKSVILIKTVRKRGDGLSGSFQAGARFAHSWQQSDNISLNYRHGNVDVFGGFAFEYARRYQEQRNNTEIRTEKELYQLNSDITILPRSTTYTVTAGTNWIVNAKNSLGFKYEFQSIPYNPSHWQTREQVKVNGSLWETIDYSTDWKRKTTPVNILNTYYLGSYGNLSFTLNNDLYSRRNRSEQNIDILSSIDGTSNVGSSNRVSSTMFASKGVLEYKFGEHQIETGYEYTHTDRKDQFFNYGDFLPNANDRIKENNIAGFATATFEFGDYELSGGMRYEHVVSDYYQNGILVKDQSRKYDRLYPNIDFSFPIRHANFTLSYTAKTKRPTYAQLGSSIQYDDMFTYETGNPNLKPEMNHDISLAGIWRWIFFSASYQYVKDAIVGIVEPFREGEPINLMSYDNFNHVHKYNVVLSLSPKFGRWSPRLRLNLMGQDFSIPCMGEKRKMNHPLLFANLYNSINLGNGFMANADVTCRTSGDMDVVTLKPTWQINLGVTKTTGNWYFQINATDVLKTARNSMITYGSQMRLNKWNYSDSQALRLTVRYSFNSTMSKYKGKGAGQQEKQRL